MNTNLKLNKNSNKKAVNTDFYQKLEFENISREIPISNLTKTINAYKTFDDERNNCTKYRLTTSINTIATNVLINPLTKIYNNSQNEITGINRTNAIATINTGYTYNCGYDIFDNHNLRINTFKTGSTLNDFTGTTISDVLSIQKAINDNLLEDNGWFYFLNSGKLNNNRMFLNKLPCEKIDLFPTRDYFNFSPIIINGKNEPNWDYTLTYPYENEAQHKLVSNINGLNGIPIVSGITGYTNENGNYLQISTPYKHGLVQGDIITFKYTNAPTGKKYQIYNTGDINGLNQEHILLLDIDRYSKDLKTIDFTNNILDKRICKIINKIESNYYIRKFRKIPNFKFENEEITIDNINSKITGNTTEIASDNYQLGFSRNIFGDKIQQIQFIDDIDINLLKDNLQRPLSEIYLTIIKKNYNSNDHNNVFGEITSGIDELPGISGYTNVRILNSNNINESPLENNITISGGTDNNMFYGDIVEFNRGMFKETILDDVYHRFNTIQRERTGNTFQYNTLNSGFTFSITGSTLQSMNEGYYYKPNYRIFLKNYSSIINQGELDSITVCNPEPFISGLTNNNNIVLLNSFTGPTNDLKFLILKIDNSKAFLNFDRLRISKLDENNLIIDSITTNVKLQDNIIKNILIPYDFIFFGNINNINSNTYVFQRYYSDSIPSYGQDLGNGKIVWRDILDEGVFDEESKFTKEKQFTNGRLYLNRDINLYVRRQDPFGYYGIKSRTFPSDPYGDLSDQYLNNNRFIKPNEIC